MNRSLKLSILMALALGSTQAAAVELGQAHVKSFLGQPLLVEIPVTQGTPAELQSLSAELAPSDAFAKVGATRPTIPLEFNVVDENGHKVILITSSTAIDDPYLDLFVKVNTGTGSSVSEVAVLLDPPNKPQEAASSAPIRRHEASSASSSSAAASSTSATPRQTTAASTHHAAPAGLKNGQYTVEKGQTLSHVAVETALAGVDKDQMMLALKAANPDAFYRDNINALKAGAILRIPSKDDAASLAAADAAAQVRQQDTDWRNGTVASAPTSVATGGTRANASVAPTATSNADRLALVPPGSEGGSAGAGSNGKGADNAKIRQELQRSQETLSSLEQQSDELKSRLKDLEDLNGKNQKLLSLKDNEIADLQKKLNEARKSAGLPPAPAVPLASATSAPAPAAQPPAAAAPAHPATTTTASSALAGASSAPKTATAPASGASAPHTAAVTTPIAPPAAKPIAHPPHHAPVAAPVAEEPWYMQTWAWAIGGGVIVLGLLALFARRGKSGDGAAKKMPKLEPTAAKGSLADRFGTADFDDAHSGSDPDQDQLLDQLAENPDDIGLHLELVSLYYTRRDVEHFEAAAEAMHAHITEADQPEWQDVIHMGQDLAPGHPLFAEADLPASTHDERSPLHQFDLDRYAGHNESASATASSPSPSKISEYHFDFDVTPHQQEAKTNPAHAGTAKQETEQESVSTWNFDEAAEEHDTAHADHAADFGELHDDPIDTKLDLARAYLDMGDPDGARAMLDEVMQEGTQMQKDVAKTLMAKIR
jgi:pilus assembly protein FimV